ncbi:hypothetical protein BLNAU_19845 [Blattamonas nauphoetae]|nr:hypothetical protein BLNAU_24154 [Blattamonas nauphoetae]KAK2945269.1 hypothetical protein BLNAU_19845 [Blattamonas nauphoetae]
MVIFPDWKREGPDPLKMIRGKGAVFNALHNSTSLTRSFSPRAHERQSSLSAKSEPSNSHTSATLTLFNLPTQKPLTIRIGYVSHSSGPRLRLAHCRSWSAENVKDESDEVDLNTFSELQATSRTS